MKNPMSPMRVVMNAFFRRRRRARFVIPKANQQIRRESDQFPRDEEQQEIVRDDDAEHGGGKEREKTEEAREVFVVRHVADAVDENQKPDERHHHEHDRSERIEHPTEAQRAFAELQPGEILEFAENFTMNRRVQRGGEGAAGEQK